MNHSFHPRQKRVITPIVPMKTVRIDNNTQIIVPASRSDEEARERFNNRYSTYRHYSQGTPNYPIKEEFKEVPIGSVEEMSGILEEDVTPDE